MKPILLASIFILLCSCGGGGSSDETGSPSSVPPVVQTPTTEELQAASKLLNVATFGPTFDEIYNAAVDGRDAWLDTQFTAPMSAHMPIVERYIDEYGFDFSSDPLPGVYRRYAFWERALAAPDQLRQLSAYALSQIFVVSDNVDAFLVDPRALATYYDLLLTHAFGNFRDLLLAVTLNPSMGFYLSHVNNAKTNESANTFPDENYAREVMQLFSIGLFELNQDGSRKRDIDGEPIPTYDNTTIREFSRIFTGLGYSPEQGGAPVSFGEDRRNFHTPMQMFEDFHEGGDKVLLNGTVVPDGQTGMQDIEAAIDNLFQHPNVGPFIGKQLIQRLATSNPSSAYVGRVAAAFEGDDETPRGDMKAVLRAILTDPEAESGIRLREPFRRYVALNRSIGVTSDDATLPGLGFIAQYLLEQHVLSAPSVFNFYQPDHIPAGEVGDLGLLGPEFQITNASTLAGMTNLYAFALYGDRSIDTLDGFTTIRLELDDFSSLADDTNALLDRIDLVFFSGEMHEELRSILEGTIAIYQQAALSSTDIARVALYLALSSPDYAIQGT